MKVTALAWTVMTGAFIVACGAAVPAPVPSGSASGSGLLLVVNQDDKNLSVVDPATNQQVALIDEHQTTMHGHEIAVGPDNRTIYMPIYGNVGVGKPGLDGHEMLVIDLPTRSIVGRVDFGHGVRPHCVIYEPVRDFLYVTTELDDTVTVIDRKTLKIVGTIATTQGESHMLAITRDGKRGYVANVKPGTVSVLDLDARTTVKVIPISENAQRIALSPDDKWAFTSDETKPRMAVIDTATNAVARWIDLPGRGFSAAATSDGRWLLVSLETDAVAVVDLESMQVARTISVVKEPNEMLIRPDGQKAYVGGADGKLSVIDLAQWKMTGTVDVGKGPDGLAWMK
jgi:DNA-binding beta-propeller fold protein YncE